MQEASSFGESPYRFSNDVVFSYVMQDPEICRGVLEAVLGRKVGRIDYVDSQHTIAGGVTVKDIRLDVMLDGEDGVYDVEMQASPQTYLMKRCRYYQARLDSRQLGHGDEYRTLRESYVIFLCRFDHFGLGLPVYTIEPTCAESEAAKVDSGQRWLVLNAQAWRAAERAELSELLEYAATNETGDSPSALISSIEEKVRESQDDDAVRGQLMLTLAQKREEERETARTMGLAEGRAEGIAQGLAEGRAEGIAQGLAEGEEKFSKLAARLLDEGRIEDLRLASEDAKLKEKLYEELGIG